MASRVWPGRQPDRCLRVTTGPRPQQDVATGFHYNIYTFAFHAPFNSMQNAVPPPFSKGKPLIEFGQLFLLQKGEKNSEVLIRVFFLHFIRKGLLSVKGVLRMASWCYKL